VSLEKLPLSHNIHLKYIIMWIFRVYIINNVRSPFVISKPQRTDVLTLNFPPCRHISLSYVMGFDIKIIHQRIQTTRLHASCCHYCNVDFVLFHNVTCYTNSLLSHIHVNTTSLLNIMCILDATSMILRK
jgi:hypothetical protein